MILNGKEYKVPEIKSFKDMVALEAKGIKIMALVSRTFYNPSNLATSLTLGISYFTGLSFEESLDEVEKVSENGGEVIELLNSLMDDIAKMEKIGAIEGFLLGQKKAEKAIQAVKESKKK